MRANKKVMDAVRRLSDDNGGQITADEVWKAAQNVKKQPHLFKYFRSRDCFDPKKAQLHWGVTIARELIRGIKMEITTTHYQVEVSEFVRDPTVGNTQGYTTLTRLRSDRDSSREVVTQELVRAKAAIARAKAVATGLDLMDEFDLLLAQLDAMLNRGPSGGHGGSPAGAGAGGKRGGGGPKKGGAAVVPLKDKKKATAA